MRVAGVKPAGGLLLGNVTPNRAWQVPAGSASRLRVGGIKPPVGLLLGNVTPSRAGVSA